MTRQRWTDDQLETLRLNYANWPTYLVAHVCGHPERATYAKALQLGLRKSPEYLASPESGRVHRGDKRTGGRFKPGHASWNKGTHYTAGGRSAETRFKPGNKSGAAADKERPIGTERICKDGYLERKTNDGLPMQARWEAVHRIVWREANGPIPPGHAVAFKPGRRTTDAARITADGLELVSRRELMLRNSRHYRYPPEVNQLMQLKGALNRKINNRSKRNG